jgi:predicted PurR-regulated permease PerM
MHRSGDSLSKEVLGTLGGYVAGQLKVAAIVGLLYTIGFAIARVPAWFVIGPICGALNLVPIVGPLIALLLAAYITLFGDAELYNFMAVLVTFVVVQGIEGFYLTPKVLGRRVGLRPLPVFLAIAVGGFMFGPLGVVLAVPVLAIVAVFWRRARSTARS